MATLQNQLEEAEDVQRPHSPLRRGLLILLAAVGFVLAKLFLPLNATILATNGHSAEMIRSGAAILVAAGFLWLTEAIPLAATALLIPLLGVTTGSINLEPALATFADPIIFLFLGGFLLAGTLHHHGLDAWVARRILLFSKGHFLKASLLLIIVGTLLSVWISNTATAAMLLPLAMGMVHTFHGTPDERRRAELFLLLGIGFGASIGGVGSVVGTPPNGIAAKQLGISFTEWFRYGLPLIAVWLPAMILILLARYRPSPKWRIEVNHSPTPWTTQQKVAATIFLLTVCGWLFSSPMASFFGIKKGFDSIVVLGSIALIFISGSLNWKQAESSVEWGVLLLFGGGLCLGKILEDTGCSVYLARWFAGATHGWSMIWLLLALGIVITLLSEVASNTAVATLMVPIFAKVATEMGLPPEKLVIPVALAASCGFALPVATPPNALLYGTGKIPQQEMLRAGGMLDITCILLLTLLACFLF